MPPDIDEIIAGCLYCGGEDAHCHTCGKHIFGMDDSGDMCVDCMKAEVERLRAEFANRDCLNCEAVRNYKDVYEQASQAKAEVERLSDENEQLRVQLAGCSVAALGGGEVASPGDYGWSASYQDVLTLRAEVERLRANSKDAVSWVNDTSGWPDDNSE